MDTFIYLGRLHLANSRIEFIKSVRDLISESDKEKEEYRLKTLVTFYDNEVMKKKGMIELILPSSDLEYADSIRKYVASNNNKFRGMVVIMYYPREVELIVMPLLYLSAKAVIARTNNLQGICVYSEGSNEYVLGQTYSW